MKSDTLPKWFKAGAMFINMETGIRIEIEKLNEFDMDLIAHRNNKTGTNPQKNKFNFRNESMIKLIVAQKIKHI